MWLLCGRRREEIWNKLPLKNLKSPLLLPDGNLLYCPWRDGWFWTWAIVEEIYYFQTYDRLFEPKRNFTVIDVGAHIGIYTLRAAKKVGEKGRVIAVEPEDENYRVLMKNIKINRYKNVVPVKLALSDFEGTARFYVKSMTLSHSLRENVEIHNGCAPAREVVGITEVTVTSLTKLMDKLGVPKIDLLKIDAEGVEFEVLKGSNELLAQHRISKVVVAAYHTSDESRVIKEYLEKFGYEVNIIEVAGRKYLHAVCPSQEDTRT